MLICLTSSQKVKSSAPLGKIGGRIGGKISGKIAGIIGGKKTAVSSDEDTKDCEAARMVSLPLIAYDTVPVLIASG